jgi:uncharacterized membrane protein
MSLIEKRLWVQTGALAAVYALFLVHVVAPTGLRDLHPALLMTVFVVVLVLLLNADLMPVLWYQRRMAREGGVLEDERDLSITLASERAGGVALVLFALTGALSLIATQMMPELGWPGPRALSLTAVVFSVVTGVTLYLIVRTVAALARYRA